MKLRDIFDVFSRREDAHSADSPGKPLGREFRTRLIMLCLDRFGNQDDSPYRGDYRSEFLVKMHRNLQYLEGRNVLAPRANPDGPAADLLAFLPGCTDDRFLDFLEQVFKLEFYGHAVEDYDSLVNEINDLFEIDSLPYALTPFVWETRTESRWGSVGEAHYITEYPRVIRRDSQIPYSEGIKPALELLAEKQFGSANREFLNALEDYRRGDYGDCLTKCASALESTLKLVCDAQRWPYDERDTASGLIRTVLANSTLDTYFEQPLMIIATLRNRLSTSHGAGPGLREASTHRAQFAINATAAAILLVIQECT